MICKISDRRPRGNHAKAHVEGSKLAQKRLERRLPYPSFLWTRRFLERLQAIENKQGWTMRDELRESLALLPGRSDPWIWISKPSESSVKEFICGRSIPSGALSIEGPAKNELGRTIVFSSEPPQPTVDERRLPDTGPCDDADYVHMLVRQRSVQESDILLSPKNIAAGDGPSRY